MNGRPMSGKQFVHKKDKVLVVGTTSDYIEWIQTASPGRALFLTAPDIRENAWEPSPWEADEIVTPLDDFTCLRAKLDIHLDRWNQRISGVACFDCESLETASRLSSELGIEYPDVETIRNCRDKYLSKRIWQDNGICCPEVRPVDSLKDAVDFLSACRSGIVLKPFCGSGSELVFKCRTKDECSHAFSSIMDGLKKRCTNPLFKQNSSLEHLMLAEEFIEGSEYSCDFIVENNTVRIIRMTRKIKSTSQPFGTASGYIIPAVPPYIDLPDLEAAFLRGASALGIQRGLCMVDFIMAGHRPALIEMTPRPGGDCLPFLLKEAGNLDILSLTLDFAEGRPLPLNGVNPFTPHIALRIHAHKAGIFKGIKTEMLSGEQRVKQIHISKRPGHVITMPPADYDSWLLGHMIIQPKSGSYPETQCVLIRNRLELEIE